MKYGNRFRNKKIINSPFALVGVFILFVILAKATWNIHQKADTSRDRLYRAQADLAKLDKHKEDLSEQVSALSTEAGIEAALRAKFRAVKDGESIAVIVDENETNNIKNTEASTTPELSWLQKVLRGIGF